MINTPQCLAVGSRLLEWATSAAVWLKTTKQNSETNQFTQYSVGKKTRREQTEQQGLAVASVARDDPSTLIPGDDVG